MFANVLAATLRNLARNRLYAIIGIGGLAVAMAAALLAALFIHDELSFDRYVPGHERVFAVFTLSQAPGRASTSGSDAKVAGLLKQDFPQIERVARYALATTGLKSPTTEGGDAVAWADPDLFAILPLKAVAGDPQATLERPDGVVLTRAMARKYFGRDDPIGQTLQLGRKTGMRVGAVIEDPPPSSNLESGVFASGRSAQSMQTTFANLPTRVGDYADFFRTYVQLKDPHDAAAINAALPGFVDRRIAPLPAKAVSPFMKTLRLTLVPITAMHMRQDAHAELAGLLSPLAVRPGSWTTVYALSLVAALILVVASANFINLQTARGARRATEVGVRKSSGATRGHLIAQFLGESVLYALIALVLALALAEAALPMLQGLVRRPIAFVYWRDPAMLAFAVGLALLLGVLAGAYPAVVLSAFRPAVVLKGDQFQAAGSRPVRLALVTGQFVVLISLLLGLMGVYAQTRFAMDAATGFDKSQLLRVQVPVCKGAFVDAVRALPGVARAGCSSPPAIGIGDLPATARLPGGRTTPFTIASVGYGFFEAYGVKPLAGALPTPGSGDELPAEAPASACFPSAAVFNAAAMRALGYRAPAQMVGTSVTLACGDRWLPVRVIGVVPDIAYDLTKGPVKPALYPVIPRQFATLNVKIRPGWLAATVPAIDQAWKRSAPPYPIRRSFVAESLNRIYAGVITQGKLLGVLAGITVLIACLGVLALAAFTTERRTKEIGVRKAMGASRRQIVGLLLWSLAQPVLLANLVAWPIGGLLLQRWLQGFSAHISLTPAYFLAAGGAAVAVALLTVAAHALRVARQKPVRALRYE